MDPSASPSTPPPETPAPAAPEEPVDSSTQLQFTVLYGAHSSAGACCYMLEIAGCVILLDCGWDESWDPALLEPLERVAQDVRLIIVSHADIEHAGALPYAYKKFKLNAQCYVTSPVLRLCHLALYDAVLSGGALYTLDDVDQAMGFLHELKYQQPLELQLGAGKESIKVIPHAAGRTLGGAVWRVSQEPSLNILYASDVLQRGERFLDGLALKALGKNPALLIQDVLGISQPASLPVKQRDQAAAGHILAALRAGGDVLVPTDSTGRVLELLLLLDETWAQEGLVQAYDLVFLTRVSSVLDVASSHVEWASSRLQKQLDLTNGQSPFTLPRVAVVDSVRAAFEGPGPRVVVCAGVDLAKGSFSRDVFARFVAGRRHSLVLLVGQSHVAGSVAQQLAAGARVVSMQDERLVELEGEELLEWRGRQDALQDERERERATDAELVGFVQEEAAARQAPAEDAAVQRRAQQLKPVHAGLAEDEHAAPMFSFPEPDAKRWDQYGQVLDEDARALLMDDEARRLLEDLAPSHITPPPLAPDPSARRSAPGSLPPGAADADKAGEDDDIGPRKKISVTVQLPVLCNVQAVDFDGRANGKDLLEIVNQIKPKKLVVVRAGLRDSERFATECHQNTSCGTSVAPAPGECLDLAADSSVVKVRLPEETLASCPPPVKVGALVVQRVRGRMALLSLPSDAVSATDKRQRRVVGAGGELPSVLPAAANSGASAIDGECWWLSRGEPSLISIRDALVKAGMPAAFHREGGVLVCGAAGEGVCVFKPAGGSRLLISGPLGSTYFQVRKLVYGTFQLV